MNLSNVTIGRKLALLLATGIGPTACIGAFSLWALSAIRNAGEQQQIEADKMLSAQRVGGHLGAVNAVTGHVALSRHCESCHGVGGGGDMTELARLANEGSARAGSAGKGFAVVANEIKALAQQTAGATEDIKARIAGVQSATPGGVAEIEKVSRVIDEVSGIVASIAAAIEEQASATKGIAGNIAEASLGVTDANKRVAETSHVSREIARDIIEVDRAAGEIASGTDHVRRSAEELSNVAEKLTQAAARFTI
jgi:mono/diheme cytochrome c family protein